MSLLTALSFFDIAVFGVALLAFAYLFNRFSGREDTDALALTMHEINTVKPGAAGRKSQSTRSRRSLISKTNFHWQRDRESWSDNIRVPKKLKPSNCNKRNLERPKKQQIQNPDAEVVSGRAIWSFYPLNYSFHVPRLFPFQHAKLPAARGAGRHKVQFLMRRQHQMVAFAAPGHMIAKPAPVRRFSLFPLDWDVFIESGHSLPSGQGILVQPRVESKERKDNRFHPGCFGEIARRQFQRPAAKFFLWSFAPAG